MREAPTQETPLDQGGAENYGGLALILIGFAASVYACACLSFLIRSVRRAAVYYNWTVLTSAEQQQWRPYRRNDTGRFSVISILIGGFFLLPWRVPLAVLIVVSNGVWAALLARAASVEDPRMPPTFFQAKVLGRSLRVLVRLHSRMLLYVFGIWRIEEHLVVNGNKIQCTKEDARLIVSNHVSCLDIPYFMFSSFAAFVSKSALQKVPFVGAAADSLNCIYVDRDDQADRKHALHKIKERCKLLLRAPDANPLVIFPEGTTTNGRCLLRFKRGAFCVFQPVQPVVLVYRCGVVDVAYELLPSLDWIILTLSSTGLVKLEAYWLPPIEPPPAGAFLSEEERAAAFASAVHKVMWTELRKRSYPSLSAPSPETCPEWRGSGRLRLQLEHTLVERQRQHVLPTPSTPGIQGACHMKRS